MRFIPFFLVKCMPSSKHCRFLLAFVHRGERSRVVRHQIRTVDPVPGHDNVTAAAVFQGEVEVAILL